MIASPTILTVLLLLQSGRVVVHRKITQAGPGVLLSYLVLGGALAALGLALWGAVRRRSLPLLGSAVLVAPVCLYMFMANIQRALQLGAWAPLALLFAAWLVAEKRRNRNPKLRTTAALLLSLVPLAILYKTLAPGMFELLQATPDLIRLLFD